ncbi:hypothetical protein LG047_07440 [Methylocystis sp. WRRC1]|uniref:hypothetical protein n=1 Tax=Methylocystis sp. WRRC1 TaxID=1732014 RepID=UPI001D138CB4|nr:hypothetical protein [Methylocystis sp. WRRC1]MCC3245152.1 hypothetical protein [Methylocystis sp. WRRC1]
MEQIKRRLKRAFWIAVALIFLLESWLWDHVREWLRALERALGMERMEPWLRDLVARMSPPATLALFAIPALAVFPLKLLAVAVVASGHVVTGVIAIFIAKTLALGVTSFLFDICRNKLLEMQWFGRFYSLVLDARAWASALVAPLRAQIHELTRQIRMQFAKIIGPESGNLRRGLARLRELARPKRSA